MKHIFLISCLLALALNCTADQQVTNSEQMAAKAAIKEFAGALQTELKTAMQAGGPVAAIGVCNTRALPIAKKTSAEHDMALSRVSLKYRNPANVPNDWQKAVLEGFESQKAAGKGTNALVWSETASVGGEKEFRFMKAIPTGGVCLACHGESISPEVQQQLSALYPEDRATGFREGDIRGAFVVTRKLSN
jgi:hypothetical protein